MLRKEFKAIMSWRYSFVYHFVDSVIERFLGVINAKRVTHNHVIEDSEPHITMHVGPPKYSFQIF